MLFFLPHLPDSWNFSGTRIGESRVDTMSLQENYRKGYSSDSSSSTNVLETDQGYSWSNDDVKEFQVLGKKETQPCAKEKYVEHHEEDSQDYEEDIGNIDAGHHFQLHKNREMPQNKNGTYLDQGLIEMFSAEPRSTRARVNYNENSFSEGSEDELKTIKKAFSLVHRPRKGLQRKKGEYSNCMTSDRSKNLKDEAKLGLSMKGAYSQRKLVKSSELSYGSSDSTSSECGDASIEHPHRNEYAQRTGEQSMESFRSLEESQALSGDMEARKLEDGQEANSSLECNSSMISGMQYIIDEIKCLPYVYVRRKKPPRENSKIKLKETGVVSLKDAFQLAMVKVDMFGPYTGDGKYRPVVKRVSTIEKILSVRNRGTDAAIYCVKLSGRGYRNVVYVHESLLAKGYSQLLRCFWRRMDDLKRVNGNLGDKADGPAFDPQYNQIDRVLAAEEKGKRRFYFIKWKELPYSESTWEAEDSLVGDKDALKRYIQISAKGALGSNSMLFKDGRVLRDYQKKGLAWMDHNYENQVNCILADEMGLGKTIQSISMLQNLRVKWKVKGPFLVVAPVSTLAHWKREIESLTDMNCVVYAGSMDDRNIMRDYEFYVSSRIDQFKFNVLLTGYEILIKDHSFLSKHQWKYIIIDEAHRLKTKQSKTTRTLKEMWVKKGGLLLLTGTPVQNNTREIFSLLNILDPDQFSSEDEFLTKYGDIKNAEQVKDLQENILKPRLLRRMKEDVEKSIPMKEETIVWVELTKDQRFYYRAIYENRISDLLKGSQNSNIPNLRNVAMELRKLCNHPYLCDGLEEHLASKNVQESDQGRAKAEDLRKRFCQSSGKMLLLDKLLPMLKDAGRRVLIFSQFTMMLDLLEDYLLSKGYSYERIDGKIRGSQRQAAIDRYSARDSQTFVFLLSTRAGGLGITLTAADTCIIYDSDWNPQNDLQAMARCHRIGQTKDVKIYRLITRNTYEQHLFECSSRKYGLDEAILGNNLGANVDVEHTRNIEALLKRGAYDILKEDGDAEAAAFHDENIDQILEQRTQKRLIGGRSNNTFSVATFVSNPDNHSVEIDGNEKNGHVNMESENFWQDLLPDACQAALNAETPQVATSTGPRKRAQVNYKEKREISDDEGSSEDEVKVDGKRRSTSTKRFKDVDIDDDLKQWSERDVKRLENRLIMLGKGREEKIMIEAELEHHGLVEVQQVIETLIQLFHYFEEKETRRVSSNETESKSKEKEIECQAESSINPESQDLCWPKIPLFAQKALTSHNSILRIQKNASKYLQALHERDILSKTLSDENFSLINIPRSKKLPSWWGDTEDLHLMRGALQHGHKEFIKIRDDPSLCFLARLNAQKQADSASMEPQILMGAHHDYLNGERKDDMVEDGWPQDYNLTKRLKKIIECLPNGLSDREIKRRAAIAEAARKRWWSARQGQVVSLVFPQDLRNNLHSGFTACNDGSSQYEKPESRHEHDNTEDMRISEVLQQQWSKHNPMVEETIHGTIQEEKIDHSMNWMIHGALPDTEASLFENISYPKRRAGLLLSDITKRSTVEMNKQEV